MAMQQQALPLPGITPHRQRELSQRSSVGGRRWSSAARKCSTSAAATATCCSCWRRRGIDGRGIELSREGVNRCVAKGLAVVQGDADTDLVNYPDDAFDYVILSQTLQATRQPRVVLENLLRIGRRAIVSFPNFGFWRMRLQLLVGGHMPRTENLPATWYDTPNIHFCTIKDFVQLCDEINVKMERAVALDLYGRPLRLNAALVVLEHVRRAGRVPAEPGGEGEVKLAVIPGRCEASNPECLELRVRPRTSRNDGLPAIDRGSRTGQRPASTSAMKRSTISLNSAGSSRLSTWPDFGNSVSPAAGKMLLQEQARLDAGVVLVAADDQRRRRRLS